MATQLELLEIRIPYDEDIFSTNEVYTNTLNNLLEDTKYIALSNLYPFKDWSTLELPTRYNNWQIRACIEKYTSLGTQGIISYSENGLNWTKKTDGISQELIDELMPNVGTIKKTTLADETTTSTTEGA